jgi:hypothetical protein
VRPPAYVDISRIPAEEGQGVGVLVLDGLRYIDNDDVAAVVAAKSWRMWVGGATAVLKTGRSCPQRERAGAHRILYSDRSP